MTRLVALALTAVLLPAEVVRAAAVDIPPEEWFNTIDRWGYYSKTYDSEQPPIDEVLPSWVEEYHWSNQDRYYDLPEIIGKSDWKKSSNGSWRFGRSVNLKQRIREYYNGQYYESYVYPFMALYRWNTCPTGYKFKESYTDWQNWQFGQPGPTCTLTTTTAPSVEKSPNCPGVGNPCNPVTGNKFDRQ